eukprot:13783668-Ditylum_brightwellii.AAC.1
MELTHLYVHLLRNYFVTLWFYTYALHATSFTIPSKTKTCCRIPTKGPHISTVKCLYCLPDTGQNWMLHIWTRCHNAGYTGWRGHIMCDQSWRPLPVRDGIVVPYSW